MRTRLPVKVKLAVVTAALTFGILCLFAVVIGAVAEQRIRAGFDDDLRATAAGLINRLGVRITAADQEALVAAGLGDAEVRLLDRNGQVVFPEGFPPLGGLEGIADFADYRVVSRALTVSREESGEPFGPLVDENVAEVLGFVQYAKPRSTVSRTVSRVRIFLAFGVLSLVVLLIPYLRQERWSWWATWIPVAANALPLVLFPFDEIVAFYAAIAVVMAVAQLMTLRTFGPRKPE